MRFLLSRVIVTAAAVALSTRGVSGLEVCYPGCGLNDYTGYTSTLTPWNTKSISLPKFDSEQGGNPNARQLTKVTINTKVFFETEVFVTCTSNCGTTFTGTATPGVKFGMYPSSTANAATQDLRTKLPQYWGRWGDYRLDDPTTQYDMSKRASVWDASGGGAPFFVPYTYPFFDIPGFVPDNNDPGTPNKVWTYLLPTTNDPLQTGSPITTLFYGGTSDKFSVDGPNGRVVIYNNPELGDNEYSEDSYNPGSTVQLFTFGEGGVATPDGTEVSVGKLTYDGTTSAFTKTISINDFSGDDGGGILNNIKPQDMLDLFTDSTSSGDQIVFDTDAQGFFAGFFDGGNHVERQVTTGYALMQIKYEYTGVAIAQGDPQFSGFQGQSFQVHGYPGSYFHLMSAPQFQMNGRFSYIANGHCNYNHTACWTHPGTYIDDVAIIVDELLVRITAGAVGQGYTVRINDEPFHAHSHGVNETADHTDVREFVPTKFYDAATRLTVHLRSPLEIHVRTDLFALTIHNADHFFNIDSQLLVRPILQMGRQPSTKYPHPQNGKAWFPDFPIHGFIGQTWAKATYANNKQYQGDVDDYVETRPYATESIYSQYFKKFDDKNMNWEN